MSMRPVYLPKDSVFCECCFKLMPLPLFNAMVHKDVPCGGVMRGGHRCRSFIAQYTSDADRWPERRKGTK